MEGDHQELSAASIYIAKYTLKAISNLFLSAHEIKKWLIECARIVGNEGNPVSWITPMGVPVVQPYRKLTRLDEVNSIMQNLRLTRRNEHVPINKNKQKTAFPPNFVHSLDSAHMMYTAERCKGAGLTFAAVHDSYWTHASTVEEMNSILREEFIRLHSEPILENLKRSFEVRYPELSFPVIPKRGDFDLQNVKESRYFFS
jgi:DNA-directed RNA polymerase